MLIDWFTVLAQIINFLILIWLLRYFLYDRVVAAMDRRQQEIASRWEEADRKQQEADEEMESYRAKIRELDDNRKQLTDLATADADTHRRELVAKARDEVEDQRRRWANTVSEEKDSFLRHLREQTAKGVCSIARRALSDLADVELEQQAVDVFLQRVSRITGPARGELIGSIRNSNGRATVRSAFAISEGLRERIVETLWDCLADDLDVSFEVVPELICGIALCTDGHKVGWEFDGYLDSLEEEITQSLEN